MKKTLLFSFVGLLIASSAMAGVPFHNSAAPIPRVQHLEWADASDSTTIQLDAAAADTSEQYIISDLPLVRDADGVEGGPLYLALTHTASGIDSVWYSVDYYFQGTRVAAGTSTGIPAAASGITTVDLDPAFPYDKVRIRITNTDAAAVSLTGVQAWLVKAVIVGAVDGS